jgi:hypothetical protein
MMLRLRLWLIAMLVAADQFGHVFLSGPKYLVFGGPCPNPDETISGKVGRMAMRGRRWARVAQWVIDGLFDVLSRGKIKGHCHAVAVREQARKTGVA